MSEKRKLPIDRPCSACSAGDTEMEYHDHHPPFREPVSSPQATRHGESLPELLMCAAQPAAGTTPRSPCDCVMEIASDGTASIQHDDACQYNIVMEAFARAIWRFFACVSPEMARQCRDDYIEEWKNGNRF